jgi:hypothetical protein
MALSPLQTMRQPHFIPTHFGRQFKHHEQHACLGTFSVQIFHPFASVKHEHNLDSAPKIRALRHLQPKIEQDRSPEQRRSGATQGHSHELAPQGNGAAESTGSCTRNFQISFRLKIQLMITTDT